MKQCTQLKKEVIHEVKGSLNGMSVMTKESNCIINV